MSLKAGRVGVAPDQVDEFGKIKSEATASYTKQEADVKFETQLHAASTYETKTDAAALQPINLSVPIEMMSGTKLTVEQALNGLNGEIHDIEGGSLFRANKYNNGQAYGGDCDSLSAGVVYVNSSAVHAPSAWTIILTFAGEKTPTSGYMCQLGIGIITPGVWYRSKNNGVWGSWNRVAVQS